MIPMINKFLAQYTAFVHAGMFVTRYPLARLILTDAPYGHYIPYLPIWGMFLALPAAGLAYGMFLLGVPWLLCSGLMLGCGIVLSGALHEDGFADCCDGFWGGHTPETRHAIMKDSPIGSYGTLGLVFNVAFRWLGLGLLEPSIACGFFLLMHVLPRGFLGLLWARMPNWSGASLTQQRPSLMQAYISALFGVTLFACLISFLSILPFDQWQWALILVGTMTSMFFWAILAVRKLGGINGDCLGAAEQLGQMVMLLLLFVSQ